MKRKHNFVVGFKSEGNVAYGKDNTNGTSHWATLMTLGQAKKALEKLRTSSRIGKAIFKLVEVKQP